MHAAHDKELEEIALKETRKKAASKRTGHRLKI